MACISNTVQAVEDIQGAAREHIALIDLTICSFQHQWEMSHSEGLFSPCTPIASVCG